MLSLNTKKIASFFEVTVTVLLNGLILIGMFLIGLELITLWEMLT